MTKVTGILLAAGQSTRFGTDKLLHVLDNGKTIVQQSADTLIQACPDSIAVINNNASELIELLTDSGLHTIKNSQAEKGMGSSIAYGVSAINNAEACIVALADMPFIKPETITHLIQHIQNKKCIIALSYKGQRGHPVAFSKHFFPELAQLNNDKGARQVIKNNLEYLTLIEIDDAGIIRDIDVKEDLIQIK